MFVTNNTPTSLSCSWEMDSSRGRRPGRLFPDNVIKCIRNWNPSLEQYICRDETCEMEIIAYLRSIPFSNDGEHTFKRNETIGVEVELEPEGKIQHLF